MALPIRNSDEREPFTPKFMHDIVSFLRRIVPCVKLSPMSCVWFRSTMSTLFSILKQWTGSDVTYWTQHTIYLWCIDCMHLMLTLPMRGKSYRVIKTQKDHKGSEKLYIVHLFIKRRMCRRRRKSNKTPEYSNFPWKQSFELDSSAFGWLVTCSEFAWLHCFQLQNIYMKYAEYFWPPFRLSCLHKIILLTIEMWCKRTYLVRCW